MSKTIRSPPNKVSKLAADTETPEPSPKTSPLCEKNPKKTVPNRSKRQRPAGDENFNELEVFKNEMKELMTSMFSSFSANQDKRINSIEKHLAEVKLFTSPIADIEKSISFVSEQLEDVQAKIDRLEGDRKKVRLELTELHDSINMIEKQNKKTSIEIRNVPKKLRENKEDMFNLINNLLNTLQIEFNSSDIRDVFRIPNNKAQNNSSTLVAEFSNTLVKGKVLEKARSYNIHHRDSKLSAKHLGLTDSQPIYISELLTAKGKRLYFLARELARSEGYSYCWTSYGNIYLRRREGMPQILVKNESQLESLKVKAN